MPAWYDLYGLTPNAEEDGEGIDESAMILHSMIDAVSFFLDPLYHLFSLIQKKMNRFVYSCLMCNYTSI